ncbi:hypothetical protein DSECCO2_656480 [anaerobic digester metagenome]
MQALFGNVQFHLVGAQPLLQLAQVLLLDQDAFGRQHGHELVMGEAQHGELVAVQAAGLDGVLGAGLQGQAGDGFHRVLVADAEGDAVDEFLQVVAGPHHRAVGGEFREVLEPHRVVDRQLVLAAPLLDEQVAALAIKLEGDLAAGQLAEQVHERAPLHARQAGLFDVGGIRAPELDVRVGGQHAERTVLGLQPDGAQVGRARLGGDDAGGLLQAFDDIFLLDSQKHIWISCCSSGACVQVRNRFNMWK